MKKWLLFGICVSLFSACGDDNGDGGNGGSNLNSILTLETADTMKVGSKDNAEIIRALPDGEALLISSKVNRVTRLKYDAAKGIQTVDQATISLPEDDEFTSGQLFDDKTILITHTILEKSSANVISGCGGELMAMNIEAGNGFGQVLGQETVGAMPDAVAVSPNKKWAVTCDEHDSEAKAWGKCTIEDIKPSVTLVDLSKGVADMSAAVKITFSENTLGPREPEYAVVASDNDTVMVTLQDSDEVAIFKISAVLAKAQANGVTELDEADVKIVSLPVNDAEAQPWPDGILSIDIDGKSYFVIAGEWNDTIITLDAEGNVISNMQIKESEVPSNYPCVHNGSDPLYSPDSLASFKKNGKTYIAATLRHAGAVIVYDYSKPATPVFSAIAKVGENDSTSCSEGGSSVRPEGISTDGTLIWVANEKESSVSVIKIK